MSALPRPGPTNGLGDVTGLRVGHSHDDGLKSGSTVVLCDTPALCAVSVVGGAPGTRETDLLAPDATVERVDALVLSGGSAFGLDAASGVMTGLRDHGRGFAVGDARVPIVPAAILFDLMNGGDKTWAAGDVPPYAALGRKALDMAFASHNPAIGTVGAGFGATTATVKGGLGTASQILPGGGMVAALIAVNAVGNPLFGDGPHFRAAPLELSAEFGGLGGPATKTGEAYGPRLKTRPRGAERANTTIGVVATDRPLTKAQAHRLARMAHNGLALSLWPAHTPFDGDTLFILSTAENTIPATPDALIDLGMAATACVARAVARGVYAARPDPRDIAPAWITRFG